MFEQLWRLATLDVGIDLGTANVVVHVRGKGVVIRQPSVVARHMKTKEILAMGEEAKKMLGKNPANIEVVRPLRDGVIADFDAAEAMLNFYIHRVTENNPLSLLFKPTVIVGIPSGVTEVERRAVQSASMSAGAGRAFLIEEPMAAAIGAGINVLEPQGRMIVDIGGGTTEIAVISLGGIVVNKSIRVAGDEFDETVINFVRTRYGVIIGESTAERTKIAIGSASPFEKDKDAK
jgi:rod shape-determining protein MreB